MDIVYSHEIRPETDAIITLYKRSGLPRPVDDPERIRRMFEQSNLVVSAWQDGQLVGVCRCITDWAWCCYLSDLAVDPDCKQSGIGRELVNRVREQIGEECMLLLLSVPSAMTYYPKIGFSKEDRGFMIPRSR